MEECIVTKTQKSEGVQVIRILNKSTGAFNNQTIRPQLHTLIHDENQLLNFVITSFGRFCPKPRNLAHTKIQMNNFIYGLIISISKCHVSSFGGFGVFVRARKLLNRKKNRKKSVEIQKI